MKIRTSAKMVPNLFYSATQQNEIQPPQLKHEKQLFRELQNKGVSSSNRKKDRKHRGHKQFIEQSEVSEINQSEVQNKQNSEISSYHQTILHQQQATANHKIFDIKQKSKLILDLQSQEDADEQSRKEQQKQKIVQTLPEGQNNNTQQLSLNIKRLHLLDWASDNESESMKDVEALIPFEQQKIQVEKQILSQLQQQINVKEALFKQISQNKIIKCIIRRDKNNSEGITEYNVYFQHNIQHLLTIKKEGIWKYSFYLREARPGPHFLYQKVASLWATFFGNNYTLIKHYQKYSQLTVSYQTNLLGLNGPRKMQIYTPKKVVPYEYLNECLDTKQWQKQVNKYVNKQAKWDEKLKCYTLNFKARALKSSIKNFVITDQKQGDNYFIIFAKADQQVYNLDISYPFSLIQGIGVAITSFQRKLTCD